MWTKLTIHTLLVSPTCVEILLFSMNSNSRAVDSILGNPATAIPQLTYKELLAVGQGKP